MRLWGTANLRSPCAATSLRRLHPCSQVVAGAGCDWKRKAPFLDEWHLHFDGKPLLEQVRMTVQLRLNVQINEPCPETKAPKRSKLSELQGSTDDILLISL